MKTIKVEIVLKAPTKAIAKIQSTVKAFVNVLESAGVNVTAFAVLINLKEKEN